MRIGVMLRTIDEKQGIGIYTQNLMDHMIPLDDQNEYVLFYRNPDFIGRYKQYDHVREKLVGAHNKALWDQVRIPLEVYRENVDIVFHTKFTVPLLTAKKTVMVMHGSEWFVHPGNCGMLDRFYIKVMMPLYCRKASAISSVSRFTANDIIKHVGIDPAKLFVVHSAISSQFKRIQDERELLDCRNKFKLPQRFILYIGKSYPGKNFNNTIKAFRAIKEKLGAEIKLVAVGDLKKDEKKYSDLINSSGLHDDIIFTGWVDQSDLPAIYSLADLLLFPSFYEGFGIPILEAMACGCPVVTSLTGSPPEIAGDASLCVNPGDVDGIAESSLNILRDDALRMEIIRNGYEQVKKFSWNKAAAETISIFKTIASKKI